MQAPLATRGRVPCVNCAHSLALVGLRAWTRLPTKFSRGESWGNASLGHACLPSEFSEVGLYKSTVVEQACLLSLAGEGHERAQGQDKGHQQGRKRVQKLQLPKPASPEFQ